MSPNSNLSPDDEALLAAILSGSRSEHDPDVAAAMARQPSLRAEVARLTAITRSLDRSGRAQREAVAQARQGAAADVDLARMFLARHQLEVSPRPRRQWHPILVAAAALLLVVVGAAVWSRGNSPPPYDPTKLRSDQPVEPRGATARSAWPGRFDWQRVAASGEFELEVHASSDGRLRRAEPLAQASVEAPSWTAPPAARAAMATASTVWWSVTLLTATGERRVIVADVEVNFVP